MPSGNRTTASAGTKAVGSAGAKAVGAGLAIVAKAGLAAETAKDSAVASAAREGAVMAARLAESAYHKIPEGKRQQIQGAAADVKATAKGYAECAAEKLTSETKSVLEGAYEARTATAAAVEEAKRASYEQLPPAARDQLDRNREWVATKKEVVKAKVADIAAPLTDKIYDVLQLRLRRWVTTYDSETPRWVERQYGRLFDAAWPDVEREIRSAVDGVLRKRAEDSDDDQRSDGGWSRLCLGFVLYHWCPYDRGFWGRLRDPWHCLFRLLTLLPVAGARVIWYALVLLLLLLIDAPPDEYQLVRYVLGFKALQFVTGGLIATIVAAVQLIACVNLHDVTADADGPRHACGTGGPGVAGSLTMFYVETAAFLLNAVLVWMAFAALRCSSRKGRRRAAVLTERERAAELAEAAGLGKRRGGRLRSMLAYDLVSFAVSCAAFAALCWASDTGPWRAAGTDWAETFASWRFRSNLWWSRVIYSLLALPFLPYALPGVASLFTHAHSTGWTRNARCVPVRRNPARAQRQRASSVVPA